MKQAGWLGGMVALLLSAPLSAAMAETDELMTNIEKGADAPPIERGNLVLVPIPMSNPTLGTGLQLAGLYLHPVDEDHEGPNPTSGVGGMYTSTDSWVAGVFHQNYLFDDRLRVMAAAGAGSLNLEYFGFGGDGPFADNPLDYSIDMALGLVRTQFRVPGTDHWFAGPAVLYSEGDVAMSLSQLVPQLPGLEKDIALGAGGLVLTYDSRDNNYYPREGVMFSASWYDYGDTFGSDFDYGKTTLNYSYYASLSEAVVLAVNGVLEHTTRGAPFFARSAMQVRGYNHGRYMDDVALTTRLEGRYKFKPRWALKAFYDAGWISDDRDQVLEGETASSIGTGIHWQTTAEKPLHLGVDVAFTEDDDTVFFIQLGERF
ncbi:BamA/TamA family outer membrane protein [Alcanivorax sp.]|uniref:BamA/TamA family outer membrane protein n=1 Tax=Alcanivorax sp. TaxID=1872427 RepID=UPI002439361A|nr:BamA/TamA family outer membrane protein [Alcanivorax sp.]